jgi:hypothetical protein
VRDELWIAAEWVLSQDAFSVEWKCDYLKRLGEVYLAFQPLDPTNWEA